MLPIVFYLLKKFEINIEIQAIKDREFDIFFMGEAQIKKAIMDYLPRNLSLPSVFEQLFLDFLSLIFNKFQTTCRKQIFKFFSVFSYTFFSFNF